MSLGTMHRRLRNVAACTLVGATMSAGLAAPAAAATGLPTFTTQPADVITTPGGQVSFSAVAEAPGDPSAMAMSFQRSTNGGGSWTDASRCSGSSTTMLACGVGLTVQLVDNGDLFRAVVNNAAGTTTSRSARLTVCDESSCLASSFSVSPDHDLVSGDEVTVTASGLPPNAPVGLSTCTNDLHCSPTSPFVSDGDGNLSATFTVARVVAFRDCLRWPCSVIAKIGSALFGDAPIAFFPVQPDAQVRRRSDGTILFDNVFDRQPPLGNTDVEVSGHAIQVGGTWTFAALMQNDGPVADDITIKASVSNPAAIGVRFFFGFYDVTSAVTGSGLVLPHLAPGATKVIAIGFRASNAALPRERASVKFTGTSGIDPMATDFVIFNVVVPTA